MSGKEQYVNDEAGSATPESSRQESTHSRPRRRKVGLACLYCRRSHMTCDTSRPCLRCVKRNIGHLCRDGTRDQAKAKSKKQQAETQQINIQPLAKFSSVHPNDYPQMAAPTPGIAQMPSSTMTGDNDYQQQQQQEQEQTMPPQAEQQQQSTASSSQTFQHTVNPALYPFHPSFENPVFFSEYVGSEFSSLTDFLSIVDAPASSRDDANKNDANGTSALTINSSGRLVGIKDQPVEGQIVGDVANSGARISTDRRLNNGPSFSSEIKGGSIDHPISRSARDDFFLTAADPAGGPDRTPEERLKQVINAKVAAGLLKPFNYVNGYARLQAYMERNMAIQSRQRILKTLSVFRPTFRAVAQLLTDVDLVLVEEAFERMILDYDRVFTSMAIPACLWRRTGEIYKGNKEFAALVEVAFEDLRDGNLALTELLSESSAVNYWEKYGNVAFDAGQKAVLTSCTLKSQKDPSNQRHCCFSFTIRRDKYNIPSCIIGNFIPIK